MAKLSITKPFITELSVTELRFITVLYFLISKGQCYAFFTSLQEMEAIVSLFPQTQRLTLFIHLKFHNN